MVFPFLYRFMKKIKKKLVTPSPTAIKWSPSSPSDEYSHNQWKATLRKIAPAVLVMEMTYACSFEANDPCAACGTAFVVDKKRGIALTNQHCATDGPATFSLRFINGEQVPAYKIYSDPLYDFAFLRFDPSLIEYMKLVEIDLHADGAQPGVEILVIGNDSDEQLMASRGILIGLQYITDIEDMNQFGFYEKSTILTGGGSSGSPVVDINGDAVGLNANGGDGWAGFISINKVAGILEFLKDEFDRIGHWQTIRICRKTLGGLLYSASLDELKDFGAITEQESVYLAEEYGTRLYIVYSLRMDCDLEESDLLLEVNNVRLNGIVDVENIIDNVYGNEVRIKVARKNRFTSCLKEVIIDADIFDMENDKPDRILDISGSSIYMASHRMALHSDVDVGCLFVDAPGASFEEYMDPLSVLSHINGKLINTFDDFLDELKTSVLGGKRIKLKTLNHSSKITGREFYEWLSLVFLWRRSQKKSTWARENLQIKRPPKFNRKLLRRHQDWSSFSLSRDYPRDYKPIEPRFVCVEYKLNGYIHNMNNVKSDKWLYGTGVVVYQSSEIGIVLVTQSNVPMVVGKVLLHFSSTIKVYATVLFVDINRGFSLIYYDPACLRQKIQVAKLSPKPLCIKDEVRLICHDKRIEESVSANCYLKCVAKEFSHDHVDANINYDITTMSGLIFGNDLKVKALIGKINDDLQHVKIHPMSSILKPLDLLLKSILRDPQNLCYGIRLPVFHAQLISIPVKDAINLGLSRRGLNRIFEKPKREKNFPMVKYCLPESNAAKVLESEDVILSINGEHVSCMEDLDVRLFRQHYLKIKILRNGIQKDVCVETEFINKSQNTRIIFWCGLLVQDTPRTVHFNEGFTPKIGVLVNKTASFQGGNPSELLRGCCWVTKVSGMEVRNLDEFVEATSKFHDGEDVLCKLTTRKGDTLYYNYRLDFLHFPTMELSFDEVSQVWNQKEISSQ